MQTNYIARFSSGKLAAVYRSASGLMCRMNENGRWLSEACLLENAQEGFTANFAKPDELQIFAQDSKGGIMLITLSGGSPTKRIILENQSDTIHTILFHSLGSGGATSLVYNIPHEESRQKLIMQNLHEGGTWDKPQEISIFSPLPGGLFNLQQLNSAHALVFYRNEQSIAGYKEITPSKFSEFVPIQRYAEGIADYSFMATNDDLHTLYISSSLFSSRLIYRRKIGGSFDAPVVLWEGQWLDNCLLSQINGALYAFFQSGGNLFMAKSQNNGETFGKPEIYKHKFCKAPVKANYISAMENESYFLRSIYVDSQNPWDIQILPDMCDNFFPFEDAHITAAAVAPPETNISEDERTRIELTLTHNEKLTRENQELRSRLEQLNSRLAEMDMSRQANNSQGEIKRLEENITSLENTISAYEKKFLQLEKENENLLKKIDDLTPRPNERPEEPSKENGEETD